MLPEDRIDGIRGDLGSKWIVDKIDPCRLGILDQGSTNDFIERGSGGWIHINRMNK
jgi:hypothetical protein